MNQQMFGRPFYATDKYRTFEISYVAIATANEIQNSSYIHLQIFSIVFSRSMNANAHSHKLF